MCPNGRITQNWNSKLDADQVNNIIEQVTRVASAEGVPSRFGARFDQLYIFDLLKRMFLPAGYPNTISPGTWLLHGHIGRHNGRVA